MKIKRCEDKLLKIIDIVCKQRWIYEVTTGQGRARDFVVEIYVLNLVVCNFVNKILYINLSLILFINKYSFFS